MITRRLLNLRAIYHIKNYSNGSKDKPRTEAPAPTAVETFKREGDNGTSKILTGEILPKDHEIFNAIGTAEELLSYIGLAREYAQEAEHEYSDKLKRIQTVIIDISTAISSYGSKTKKAIPSNHTKELEDWIQDYSKQLPPPEQYIIPGGGIASASLSVAKSICRRTERIVAPLVRRGGLDKEVLVYLNRLSDFLFTVSRIAAKHDKRTESIYIPAKPDEKIQSQSLFLRSI